MCTWRSLQLPLEGELSPLCMISLSEALVCFLMQEIIGRYSTVRL